MRFALVEPGSAGREGAMELNCQTSQLRESIGMAEAPSYTRPYATRQALKRFDQSGMG